MSKIVHENHWRWGREYTIIIDGGIGFCRVAIEDDAPQTAFLMTVSIVEPERRKGNGTKLVECAKKQAKRAGAKGMFLWCAPELVEWYKRRGFVEATRERTQGGMVGMSLEL
jgi:N-acetylglutamate synthase-like GNAT family acetyltransferase